MGQIRVRIFFHLPKKEKAIMKKTYLLLLLSTVICLNGCDLLTPFFISANISAAENSANYQLTANLLQQLKEAVMNYRITYKKFPNSLEDLVNTPNGHSLLDTDEVPLDAWGQPFQYEKNGNKIKITSIGADGKPNTEDDINIQIQ